MNDIILSTQNGEPVASSRDVAKRFGKRHDHVVRDIEEILKGLPQNGDTPMFFKSEYTHPQNHQKYPMYLMSRDGFSLLAMGFTGKEAVQWKLKYIEAFNAMEKQLAEQHKEQQALQDTRIQLALRNVSYAQKNLNIARKNHQLCLDAREDTKNLLAQARALHAKRCDQERKAAQEERDWQNYLDTQLTHLQIVAVGLPEFDEIMETALAERRNQS